MWEYVAKVPLQSQQPLFVAQHDLNLDKFIPSHQRQACYSSETELYFGQVPGMWLYPRCTYLNRRKEKISVVTNYLDWQVC